MNKRFDFHTHTSRTLNEDNSLYCHGDFDFYIPENQYFCLGIHPWFILDTKQLKKIENLVKKQSDNPFLIGIGEIGLDKRQGPLFAKQLLFFEEQVKMANKHSLAFIVIHIVKAYQEVFNILIKYNFKGTILLHDFHGNQKTLEQFQKNFKIYISYNIHSFKRKNTLEIITKAKTSIILPESDENDPKSIDYVNRKLCHLFRIDLENLKKIHASAFNNLITKENSFPIE